MAKEFETMTEYALRLIGAKVGSKAGQAVGIKPGGPGGLLAAEKGSKDVRDALVKKAKGGKVR